MSYSMGLEKGTDAECHRFPFGGALAAVIWLFSRNVAFTVVMVLTAIFGSVMMCTKDQNNQSVVDQIGNMIRFAKSQQIYPYRALSEWGE